MSTTTKQEILNQFIEDIHNAEQLTFSDIEGLVDSEKDLDGYKENYINNIFDETSNALDLSISELSDYHSKNH